MAASPSGIAQKPSSAALHQQNAIAMGQSVKASRTGSMAQLDSGRTVFSSKRYAKLYTDKQGSAVAAAAAARAQGRTATAKKIEVISKTPQARWFGDWISTTAVRREVSGYVKAATRVKRRPTMVMYAIPGRDCGQHSSGGLDAANYKKWISQVAKGIKGSKPIIILEPDSLALDCADDSRNKLLSYAAKKLTKAGAWVYLDGGHSNWRTSNDMPKRLKSAGVEHARGFATNVSNFNSTSKEKKYATKVSVQLKRLGVSGSHRNYVVDTSRNGKGSNGEWCNPSGRGLGKKPKLYNNSSALDGLLWIKRPGESDGSCNGGPSAGVWWERYAVGLVNKRAK